MIDHHRRHLTRLVASLDARILEGLITSTEDVPDKALQEVAVLETARAAALRLLREIDAVTAA